jgi:chemotaxis protein methyltransferase CheR
METDVYSSIQTNVKKLLNIDLTYYKDEQMKRRLDSWLIRVQSPSWPEYFKRLSADAKELERFRDYLTINVTEFFRDPDRWSTLRRDVIPVLVKESPQASAGGGLKVWSAGCSIGVEAYTLTMLLEETLPNRAHTILASDFDRGALGKARAGGPYLADEIRNLTAEQRQRFFKPGGPPYAIKDEFIKRITFREQDLLADRFDTNLDLIICRNVIIYFTNEAKNMLFKKFYDALRPGGVLFLGGTEIISRPGDFGYRNFGISFYKKD